MSVNIKKKLKEEIKVDDEIRRNIFKPKNIFQGIS